MARKATGFHVVPDHEAGGRWRVVDPGSPFKTAATCRTQREAIVVGRHLARMSKTSLRIHGRDGRVREERSYGNETKRPG